MTQEAEESGGGGDDRIHGFPPKPETERRPDEELHHPSGVIPRFNWVDCIIQKVYINLSRERERFFADSSSKYILSKSYSIAQLRRVSHDFATIF